MKCGGCVRTVERTLLEQPSVTNASVNLVARTALIDLKSSSENLEPILKALETRGFFAQPKKSLSEKLETPTEIEFLKDWWRQWRQLMTALILLILSVVGHLAEGGQVQINILGSLEFHAVLATVALLGPGQSILKSGAQSALSLVPNMDTLVGLGVSSAYLASLIALIWPKVGWPCFFNEPVMLLGFVLLGRFLEERARFRTGKALKDLAELQPNLARLFLAEGDIREVRVGALQPGEKIQLLAGDRIPVDGKVLTGYSAVDISSLTGEPLPIEARPGTELSSGSLNLESTLVMEVTRIGADTALARIINLVEQAQSRKAPIQGIADIIAGKFCYGVVALSLTTFIFWWQIGTRIWPHVLNASGQGLIHSHHAGLHTPIGSNAETPLGLALQLSIAVLVIACPCALGLATPTVITVASGKAARRGWLFRGGDVIEQAASIQQIIFDKTGTLTIGRPMIGSISKTDSRERMIQLAASVENNSRHPIAHALLHEAENLNLKIIESISTKTLPGKGVEGKLKGIEKSIRVGKPEWLKDNAVEWESNSQEFINNASIEGLSVIGVSEGDRLLGIISIEDRLKEDALMAINKLRRQGLNLSILSGDRYESVQKLGTYLGFKEHELGSQLMPKQKLEKLQQMKELGIVAMVGDGINDAPALAAADIGIAVGTGTQIAQDTADIVLLGERLEGLPEALQLAKITMKKIKQNLTWAFGYNLIALPIAAGVLLPTFNVLLSPPIAALLMAVSSITVVINALSLRAS